MSYVMAPANGSDHRGEGGGDERRSRARRNALLLGLLAAALYVGFIVFGAVKGIFPG